MRVAREAGWLSSFIHLRGVVVGAVDIAFAECCDAIFLGGAAVVGFLPPWWRCHEKERF